MQEGSQHILTVAENRKNYGQEQYRKAQEAQKLYHVLHAPSIKNFKYILRSNQIRNCPVTPEDVDIAEDIFGKDIAYLKGKSVRKNPTLIRRDLVAIPQELKTKHLVISEFHPNAHASSTSFVLRNRLIAALSNSTIVIEAPKYQ